MFGLRVLFVFAADNKLISPPKDLFEAINKWKFVTAAMYTIQNSKVVADTRLLDSFFYLTFLMIFDYRWYLVFQGEEGVREVLQILNDEFRLSMALSGESTSKIWGLLHLSVFPIFKTF